MEGISFTNSFIFSHECVFCNILAIICSPVMLCHGKSLLCSLYLGHFRTIWSKSSLSPQCWHLSPSLFPVLLRYVPEHPCPVRNRVLSMLFIALVADAWDRNICTLSIVCFHFFCHVSIVVSLAYDGFLCTVSRFCQFLSVPIPAAYIAPSFNIMDWLTLLFSVIRPPTFGMIMLSDGSFSVALATVPCRCCLKDKFLTMVMPNYLMAFLKVIF